MPQSNDERPVTEAEKTAFLKLVAGLQAKIGTYAFVHVVCNEKFTASIVNFICEQYDTTKHCVVVIGGFPESIMPIPQGANVFVAPVPQCLVVTDKTQKYIFHGLYMPYVVQYLSEHPEITALAFWCPWGGDVYDSWKKEPPQFKEVKKQFRGIIGSAKVKEAYEQHYGPIRQYFPVSFAYESIPYDTIINTPVPSKNYVQILVNNSAHATTVPVLQMLEKFCDQNIRVATILSYGNTQWNKDICSVGEKIFGDKFMPIMNYVLPERYIKFLAKNDIYIMNQQRPQGMTTCYTAMLFGQKVFMPASTSSFLLDQGYRIYDTASIGTLSFETFCAHDGVETNKTLAQRRFDKEYIKSCWQKVFDA